MWLNRIHTLVVPVRTAIGFEHLNLDFMAKLDWLQVEWSLLYPAID